MSPQSHLHRRSSVAVIDDDEDQRLLLRHAFEPRGYRVLSFESSEAALAWEGEPSGEGAVDLAQADLILLDVNLPGISGLETLQLLKDSPRLRHIPVAMLTAERNSETVLRCIRAGAADYFVKPIDLPEALRRIEKLLADPSGLVSKTGEIDLRWSFQEFLVRELKRAERCEEPLSILIGGVRRTTQPVGALSPEEIDRQWSRIPENAAEIHQAVEALIRAARASLREYDVLEPFGVGELAGILPATGEGGLRAVARKLLSLFPAKVEAPMLTAGERWVLLLGGATFPSDGRDRVALLAAAEGRLSDQSPPRPSVSDGDDPLYSKTARCVACGHHFSYAKALARRLVQVSRETDLRQVYEGFDPLPYSACVCSNCGLAGFEADLGALKRLQPPAFGWSYRTRARGEPFEHPTQTVIPTEIRAVISPPYEAWAGAARREDLPTRFADSIPARDKLLALARTREGGRMDTETAIARHLLLRETYRLAGASPLRRARVAHRLAWLHRAREEREAEHPFLAEALDYYLTAFHFEDLTGARPNEMEIFFLLGELSLRLGRGSDAIAIFDLLIRDPRLDEQDPFKKMVRRRWQEARGGPA
ncbi:MAG: DUF2225 domain-containing protein [Candidatus Omnitrophica bacterium]|nr:DUF2225 domain-containing protein [Candidatus Omnitrophota bacterium]